MLLNIILCQMENIRRELQTLREIQRNTEQGWTWFFDEANGIICAQKGNTVRKVFTPHTDSVDQQGHPTALAQNDAFLIAQTLNAMPKLLAALERAVAFAEGLDEMAEMRERAAQC
jgi:hypothetical protein